MTHANPATYDEVNTAFNTNAILKKADEELLVFLRLLCSTQIQNDQNRMLATNRCITINTLLTRRFMERVDRATTRYTCVVIVLAIVSVLASIAQTCIALQASP